METLKQAGMIAVLAPLSEGFLLLQGALGQKNRWRSWTRRCGIVCGRRIVILRIGAVAFPWNAQ